MAANTILYYCSHEHQKTSKDALCLAPIETRGLGYESWREQCYQNAGGSSECQREAEMGQAHLFGHENGASESLRTCVIMKPLWDFCQETAVSSFNVFWSRYWGLTCTPFSKWLKHVICFWRILQTWNDKVSSSAFSRKTASSIWVRHTLKNSWAYSVLKKLINSLGLTKQNSQARW